MNINRKKFISQSMNNSRVNDDTYSSELDIFKNYNNKKLNNRTVKFLIEKYKKRIWEINLNDI